MGRGTSNPTATVNTNRNLPVMCFFRRGMEVTMKPKPPQRQLPATRKPARLERLDTTPKPDETREKRTLVVHKHTWNWALIILALAALVQAMAAVV